MELKNQKDIYIARLRSLVETQLKMLRFHSVDLEEQEGAIAKLRQTQSILGLDLEEALSGEGAPGTEPTGEEDAGPERAAGSWTEGASSDEDLAEKPEGVGETPDGTEKSSAEAESEPSEDDSSARVPYVEIRSADED